MVKAITVSAYFASDGTGSLRWAEDHDRVEAYAS